MWARAVREEVPQACPSGYADDTGVTASTLQPVQDALDLTGHFEVLTLQKLNASKSHSCCTSAGRHAFGSLSLMSELVPSKAGGSLLGAHVSF